MTVRKNEKVSNFLDIYLTLEMVNPEDLTLPVKDGDVMMLTGG